MSDDLLAALQASIKRAHEDALAREAARVSTCRKHGPHDGICDDCRHEDREARG